MQNGQVSKFLASEPKIVPGVGWRTERRPRREAQPPTGLWAAGMGE